MSRQDNVDYSDMEMLFKGDEWRVWIKFVRRRIEDLKNKAIRQVREKNYEEAGKLVAVMDDIDKQIYLFRNIKSELNEKLTQNGGM